MPAAVRSAIEDVNGHRRSGKTLATYEGGEFTVRDLLRWTGSAPQEISDQLKSATDSQVTGFVRALALGARACIVGRSYIYGLGAGGEAGVAHAIGILGKELDVTMALCGVKNVKDIDERVLAEPRGGNL